MLINLLNYLKIVFKTQILINNMFLLFLKDLIFLLQINNIYNTNNKELNKSKILYLF